MQFRTRPWHGSRCRPLLRTRHCVAGSERAAVCQASAAGAAACGTPRTCEVRFLADALADVCPLRGPMVKVRECDLVPVEVDEDRYDEALRMRLGWCPSCEEFTRSGVVATACGLSCSECFDGRVSGARHAKRSGFIWVAA